MSQMKLALDRDPRITPVKPPAGQSALSKEKKKTVSPSVGVVNLVGGANKTPPTSTADASPSVPKPAKLVQTHLFSEKPKAKLPGVPKLKPDSKGHQPVSSTSSPALTTTSPRKPVPGPKQTSDSDASVSVVPSSSSVHTTTSAQISVQKSKSDSVRNIAASSISLSSLPATILASQKLAPGQKQQLDAEGYLLLSFTSGAATITSSQKPVTGKKQSGVMIKKSPALPQNKSVPPPLIKLTNQSQGQPKVVLSTSPTKSSSAKPLIFTPPVLTNSAASTLTLSKATSSIPAVNHAVPHSSPPLPKIPKTSPPQEDPLLPPKAKRAKTSFTSIPISRVRTIMRTNVNRGPQNPVGQESIMVIAKATERFISELAKEARRTNEENSEVGYGELAQFVQGDDKFKFLRDILPKKVLARDYIPQSTTD